MYPLENKGVFLFYYQSMSYKTVESPTSTYLLQCLLTSWFRDLCHFFGSEES